MPLWTKQDLMTACKASDPTSNFLNNFDNIHGISIDDRTIKKGELFIALIGENFDGHKFIDTVAKKGVKACLIEKKKKHLIKNKKILLIEVNSTLLSLKKLALYARNRIRNLKTICVTGSNGKTTLKEWLKETLKNNFVVYSNPGNFNNLIGMPITLANIPKNTEIVGINCFLSNFIEFRKVIDIGADRPAVP